MRKTNACCNCSFGGYQLPQGILFIIMGNKYNQKEYLEFYRNLGWTVFPVRVYFDEKGEKHNKPLCYYSNYFDTPPSPEQMEDWFEKKIFFDSQMKFPKEELFIGLITGRTNFLTVIDVDAYKKDVITKPFDKLDTMQVKTLRGGTHYYFDYCEELKQGQDVFKDYPHCDVRNNGGYVIIPSGWGKYEWVNDPNTHFSKLATVPQEFIDNQKSSSIGTKKDFSAVLTGELVIPKGERNTWYRDFTWRLLKTYKPEDKDLPFFREMVLGINKKFDPPEDESIILKHFDYSVNKWKKASDDNSVPLTNGCQLSPVDLKNPLVKPYPIDICDLTSDKEEKEWIWDGFVAKNNVTLLSALWKVGKSTFISHLLKTMQEGGIFPQSNNGSAKFEVKKSKVLILSEEGSDLWTERRDNLDITCRDTVWIMCRPLKQRLSYKKWVELLSEQGEFCRKNKVDLVIIDTLAGFWPIINENDASEVGAAMLVLNHIVNENTAVLLIHHFRKSGGDDGVAARGSGALGASVDIMIDFKRLQGSTRSTERVLKTLSRYSETPEEMVIKLDPDNDVYLLESMTVSGVTKKVRLKEVLSRLSSYPNGVTVKDFQVDWKGIKTSLRSMQRYFKDLARQGSICVVGQKIVGSRKTPIWSIESSNEVIFEEDDKTLF